MWCMCVCPVHMSETLIRDIERHFAPLRSQMIRLQEGQITNALYPLRSLLSETGEDLWWHTAQRHWEILKRESSLIPASPLRTALISQRL